MYGNDTGMTNDNFDQDINNNMTSNNTTETTTTVTTTTTTTTNDYDQGYENVSFGGFDDARTGSKKKINKWIIIIPILFLLFLIILIIILVSSANKYVVKTNTINIIIGEAKTIEISASQKVKNKLTYSSDNESIATVDGNGNVTGVAVGATKVWVGINGKKSKSVGVVVTTNKTELIFKESEITVVKDSTHQLIINNVLSDDQFTWQSGNENVATVDQTGLVTGVHGGSTTITVTESDGRKSTAKVTVTSDEILLTDISLSEQTIGIGETYQLKPVYTPGDGLKILKWESSREAVATVDQTGKVTGLKDGSTVITVTAHNGVSGKARITVDSTAVSSLKINGCVKSLRVGDRVDLSATIAPSTAKARASWSTSNNNVLSVGSNGSVTARGKGTAVVTVTAGNKTASCKISVGAMAISSISTGTSLSMKQGETKAIRATIYPSAAAQYYTINWSSNNKSVATVDQNGVVTAINPGSAKITASAGGKSSSTTVTVVRTSASTLRIVNCPTSLALGGGNYQLRAESDYSSAKISWYASNNNVTVSSSGVVTPKANGSVTVTATTNNGVRATCTFTVSSTAQSKPAITKITPSKTSVTVNKGSSTSITVSTNLTQANLYKYYTKNDFTFNFNPVNYATVTPALTSSSFKLTINGVNKGTTTMRITSGNAKADVQITVK